jgi:hypothetical protein
LDYRRIDRSSPVPETRPTTAVRANTHSITDLRSTSIWKGGDHSVFWTARFRCGRKASNRLSASTEDWRALSTMHWRQEATPCCLSWPSAGASWLPRASVELRATELALGRNYRSDTGFARSVSPEFDRTSMSACCQLLDRFVRFMKPGTVPFAAAEGRSSCPGCRESSSKCITVEPFRICLWTLKPLLLKYRWINKSQRTNGPLCRASDRAPVCQRCPPRRPVLTFFWPICLPLGSPRRLSIGSCGRGFR